MRVHTGRHSHGPVAKLTRGTTINSLRKRDIPSCGECLITSARQHWKVKTVPLDCTKVDCQFNQNSRTSFYHLFVCSLCFLLLFFLPFLNLSVNVGPPLKQKVPPLWWKIWKIVSEWFLMAQKKRLDALNATPKTSALCDEMFLQILLY